MPRRCYKIPWEISEQLDWDVTDVDAPEPSRMIWSTLGNPGTNATDDESLQLEKYNFQTLAMEVQISKRKSSERFIPGLCKMLSRLATMSEPVFFKVLKQRISMAHQISIAA